MCLKHSLGLDLALILVLGFVRLHMAFFIVAFFFLILGDFVIIPY